MKRTFKHFPKDSTCPVCHTSDDKECLLIPVDGTSDGRIEEGQPVHTDCINLRWNTGFGFYQTVETKNEREKKDISPEADNS